MNVAWAYGAAVDGLLVQAPDAALPQVARFLAGERPAPAAAAALGLPVRGDDEALLGVRYNAGLRLEIVQRAGDARAASTVRVLCVPRERLAGELAARRGASARPDRVVALESWSAVVSVAEDDPALPGLRVLAQREPFAELVSWLPDRRAVVRAGDAYAKVSVDADRAARDDALARLWAAPGRGFAMPEPLAVEPALGLRWDRALQGEPLDARLATAGPGPIVDAAARALVALHDTAPWPGVARLTAPALLARGERKVLRRLRASFPALAAEAGVVVASLQERRPGLALGAPVVVHGDFHAANALMLGDDVALLDLDGVALGDPELDLAVCGGRLVLLALATGQPVAAVVEAVRRLPDAYAAAGGRAIDPEAFAWYLAAAMIGRHVMACLRSLAPQAGRMCAAMLALAADVVAQAAT